MVCVRCGSNDPQEFGAEINLHFPGRAVLDNPGVLVFPTVLICLHCGFAEFRLAEDQLRQLATEGGEDSAVIAQT